MLTTTILEHLRGLEAQGIVRRKVDSLGMQTFKYHNKVFYNNLWDSYGPMLKEARGIVFDKDDKIVQRPFKKIFNLGENGTGLEYHDSMLVRAVRKVNGFMAAASFHKGRLVVSTTGTTTSDYARLAMNKVSENRGLMDLMRQMGPFTFIMEICDDSDPHIVAEDEGVYLLGIRHKESGTLLSVGMMESLAEEHGILYPQSMVLSHGKLVHEVTPNVDHEGFVVYDFDGVRQLYKTKSPHYLSKKALMRMGKKQAGIMFDNPDEFRKRLDEEFYSLHDRLLATSSKQAWLDADERTRRWYIEDFFNRQQRGEL